MASQSEAQDDSPCEGVHEFNWRRGVVLCGGGEGGWVKEIAK